MFERILVPLDGSERSETILGQIDPILGSKDAELILFRAVEPSEHTSPSWETTRAVQHQIEEETRRYLSGVERRLSDRGVNVRYRMGPAPAEESILLASAEENASLIAMSTHGRSGLARWMYGSVAEKILRSSTVPLFLARPFGNEAGGSFPRKILVPIDAAYTSLEVVPFAVEFARLFGAQALLMNVCEQYTQGMVPAPQLTRAYEEFQKGGVPAETLIRKGDPASEILEACKAHGTDLIALATHGRSGVSRWTLGSVAEKVLREARVPVLAVRCAAAAPPKASLAPGMEPATMR